MVRKGAGLEEGSDGGLKWLLEFGSSDAKGSQGLRENEWDRCENAIFAGRSDLKEERGGRESEGCEKRVDGVGEGGAANAKCLEGWSALVCWQNGFLRITRLGGILRPWFGFEVECGGQELSNDGYSMAVGEFPILGEGEIFGRKGGHSAEKCVVCVCGV